MEKQKFLMEILDIVNGTNRIELSGPVFELIKEAIRGQAKQGVRAYNMPTNQMYITINGVNVVVGAAVMKKVSESLIEEGFNVGEANNYYSVQW